MYKSQYLLIEWANSDGWCLARKILPNGLPIKFCCLSRHFDTNDSNWSSKRLSSTERALLPKVDCTWRIVCNKRSIVLCVAKYSTCFVFSNSQPTSGVTAAVVHPNSRFASTRSANNESPIYKTFGLARDVSARPAEMPLELSCAWVISQSMLCFREDI